LSHTLTQQGGKLALQKAWNKRLRSQCCAQP